MIRAGLPLDMDIYAFYIFFFLACIAFKQLNDITNNMQKLIDILAAHEAKIDKVFGEVSGLRADFTALKEQLENGEPSPEAQAILDRISTKLDGLDALNPDKETPPA